MVLTYISLVPTDATVTCPGFTCVSDGACLPRIWQCNGRKDCHDSSDEKDCAMVNCSSREFQCNDGECIELIWRCDDDDDCDDRSDEANCSKYCSVETVRVSPIFIIDNRY